MWSRVVLGAVAVITAACGRVGFSASTDAAAPGGDVADTGSDALALPAGAVLYLPFDQMSSQNANPVDVARGHVVTCRTTCPTVTAGKRGSAYAFVAANPDVLDIPYTADLDPSGGFTLALWIRMNQLPTTAYFCVLGKPVGTGAYNSHALCVDMLGRAFYHSGTTAGTDNLTGSSFPVGEWHHMAMTWDGTTKRGYLDGVPDGMVDVPVENDTNPLVVGADLNSGNPAYPLDGALDEVWVFDRPLSPLEIEMLAN